MGGEGVIKSVTVDILGVRRETTLHDRRKFSVYSIGHDFRSGIRGRTGA
jgi:hypothetical protein